VDRNTRETREIHARVVVLCAQTQESARILLNSRDARISQRAGQFERRPRTLSDGSCTERRRETGNSRRLASNLRWVGRPSRGNLRSEVSQFERAGAYENLLGDRRSVGHSASWDYCPRRPTGQTWWPRRKAAGLEFSSLYVKPL